MATASIRINGGTAGQADTNLPIANLVSLTNNDDTGVATYEWVIVSQPEGGQDNWTSTASIVSNEPAPTFTPTKEGSYLIKLTVNKDLPDEAVDTTICAVRELLTGDRIPAPQETTEVSVEDGWATEAVTRILQRVTRMADAGIFVARNNSGEVLDIGQVVHMDGMYTIGVGANARKIPTVSKSTGAELDTVDGPLGVVVARTNGDPLSILPNTLCRVMVMGGISAYESLGTGALEGDPVFVGNSGKLSRTAGLYVRQVGDIARVIVDGVYDIAISAGANSIPRGNALGDLSGMYPDPVVAKINETIVGTAAGKAVGNVLRLTDVTPGSPEATWGSVDLTNGDAVTGALPVNRGGTGQSTSLTSKGVVFAASSTAMSSTLPGTAGQPLLSNGAPGNPAFGALDLASLASTTGTLPVSKGGTGSSTALSAGGVMYAVAPTIAQSTAAAAGLGYILCSNSSLISGTPQWVNVLSVAHGGTGDSSLTTNGVVYGNGTAAVGVTSAGSTGALLTPSAVGTPTWTGSGSAGQLLKNNGALAIPSWIDFAEYFDDQYAGSSTATDALFSTTGAGYAEIVSVTRSCKRGMVQVTPMPIADGAAFINYITTAATNTYSTVSLKFVVTFPDASIQNYLYQFRSSTAHNNNQNTGSITFPSFTFYTSQEGDHTVSMQVQMSINDTFTANATALRISQG